MRERIIVGLYILLLALPGAAMIFGAPDRPVYGALTKIKRPTPRFWTVLSEKYQHKLTAWFESSIAFKGYSMYVDNTILARVFGETKPDAHVVIGDDDVLFLREDINGFNRTPEQVSDRAYVEHVVTRMAELQRRMLATNRLFLPVLIPSKTTVYRDKIPDRWKRDLSFRAADRLYPMMKEVLDAHGVDYVDMAPVMRSLERSRVWGPYARHWTRYAGCEAVREALVRYAKQLGRERVAIDCDAVLQDQFPGHEDFDLWQLLNASVAVGHKDVPTVRHAPAANQLKPNVLVIGTSFCWQMLKEASESGAFGRVYMNYYNQTFVEWPSHERWKVEPRTERWRAITFENDLYLLDVFETYMPLSTEIIDQLLEVVDAMPSR